MARTVFCEYLKQDAEGLDFQLYPGELGKYLFFSNGIFHPSGTAFISIIS